MLYHDTMHDKKINIEPFKKMNIEHRTSNIEF